MPASPGFESYDDRPIYTIKTIVQQTGISPATLRAWERRYRVLSPGRSEGGYRLYSERDIAQLRWLKSQVDAGVSISRAVARLRLLLQSGQPIEVPASVPRSPLSAPVASGTPRSPQALTSDLLNALLAFRESDAESVLSEAFALYGVLTVAEEIITPTLVEVGERWHRGEITIVQEHFASAFLRRRLAALLDAYEPRNDAPLALTGSAPGEWHDIGILMVSLALRRHGWRVIYLGQNVPAQHLLDEIARLRPDLVCLSATTSENALHLAPLVEAIANLPPQSRPRLALGGRGFNTNPDLRNRFPHAIFSPSARDLIAALTPK